MAHDRAVFSSDAMIDRVLAEFRYRIPDTVALAVCVHGVHKGEKCTCGDDIGDHREAIAASIAFLHTCSRVKVARYNAYSLKHRVEEWALACGGNVYVPQGALIAAAVGMGFTWHVSPPTYGHIRIGVGRGHAAFGMFPWR